MTTGKALLGVVAGFAAGAVLGILFAPHKGEKTRKNIAEKGEELAHAVNSKIDKKFNELVGAVTGRLSKKNDTVPGKQEVLS